MSGEAQNDCQGGLTDEEKRANVLRLAFGGDPDRLHEFCRMTREEIPEGTGVVLRGSAVTRRRWKDGAPFDSEGPWTHIRWGTIATVLSAGYVDSFRRLHPADLGYTLPTPEPHVPAGERAGPPWLGPDERAYISRLAGHPS